MKPSAPQPLLQTAQLDDHELVLLLDLKKKIISGIESGEKAIRALENQLIGVDAAIKIVSETADEK